MVSLQSILILMFVQVTVCDNFSTIKNDLYSAYGESISIPKVPVLNLSANDIKTIRDIIVNDDVSFSLKLLNLSQNLIEDLPEDFGFKYNSLRYLDLSNNQLSQWKNTQLFKLITLDLSYNNIDLIEPYSFANMPLVQEIHLKGNKLKSLNSELFKSLNVLTVLDLSMNQFKSFPVIVTTSVVEVNLSNCKIELLEEYPMDCSCISSNDTDQIEPCPNKIPASIEMFSFMYQTFILFNNNIPNLVKLDVSNNIIKESYHYSIETGWKNLSQSMQYKYHVKERVSIEYNAVLRFESSSNFSLTFTKNDEEDDELIPNKMLREESWQCTGSDIIATNISAIVIGAVLGSCFTAVLCKCANVQSQSNGISSNTPRTDVGGTADAVVIRIPLRIEDDNPPTYNEALQMRRLNGSFHSLPDYLDPNERSSTLDRIRVSRSTNDIFEENNVGQESSGNRCSRTIE